MTHRFDLIGVGSPIMDLLARVTDDFIQKNVAGDKGGMVLVDHDEIKRIVTLLDGEPAYATGGSAANSTYNAARLGLRTTFLGKLGNDHLARTYRQAFEKAGVDGGRFKLGAQPNARSMILVTPDAQRTMRTCLGAAMTLSPTEIAPDDFAGCRHAHIEGYLVFNQSLADAVLAGARTAGCTTSLDLSSFEVVHASRQWLFSQFRRGIDIVFANEDEIRALFEDQTSEFSTLARKLGDLGVLAAVKVGKDGAWIANDSALHRIAPVAVADVIDTNGAGDAWAAGFLYGYLRNWPLPACGALASLLGSETVMHMGPIIPDTHFEVLRPRAMALGPKSSLA
ncbi:adenosine kinase [Horticoccus sp. 23ND18S-11]|uniref:adenosine kinase n=1 Tax=Horticoccus sp. 23ND18S-11 TaxID=3391832 RepID=UPI0039C9B594